MREYWVLKDLEIGDVGDIIVYVRVVYEVFLVVSKNL